MARVLLITHISPPALDGGSLVIHKVGEYFKNQGHQVAVFSSDANSTDDFTHSYSGIQTNLLRLPVYTIFHRPLKFVSRYIPLLNVFSKGPIFKFIPFLKFLFFYIKFKPDYIIAGPLPTTIVLYARFFRSVSKLLFQKTKLLINASFHPTDPDFQNPFLIHALKSADYLWTLTDHETNYFHDDFDIPLSRMINIGNGVDKSLLNNSIPKLNLKSLQLLYIGSFAAHKGIDTIIDSLNYLPPTTSLTLAGQPTLYSPTIEAKIAALSPKTQSRIKIIYRFKSANLKKLLDNTSILISASSQESFGLVLLEAMARGVPVIGADIPATSELITRSGAGLIFKLGDPSDLAKKISKLAISKTLMGTFSKNGLIYAAEHTWDRIGESLWQKISR